LTSVNLDYKIKLNYQTLYIALSTIHLLRTYIKGQLEDYKTTIGKQTSTFLP